MTFSHIAAQRTGNEHAWPSLPPLLPAAHCPTRTAPANNDAVQGGTFRESAGMTLAIQSSFEPYVWAALWQAALAGLQAGGPALNSRAGDASDWLSRLQYAVSLMGTAVSWMAWGLGVWVAMRFDVVAGVVFTAFSFAINVIAVIELHRWRPNPLKTQALCFVAMPIFAVKTLAALGVIMA
jgi:hypothetical protein